MHSGSGGGPGDGRPQAGDGYGARDGGEGSDARIFVGGIPFKWDDRDLRDYFMKLGNVISARVCASCPRPRAALGTAPCARARSRAEALSVPC
jgi:hypothetical protein